jgi:hypothetical protein
MFKRLAKSGLVKFWPVQTQRIAPGLHKAGLSHRAYCNDNLPGFRYPAAADKRRSPTPVLACHWLYRNGRLECRWQVADEAPTGGFDERRHSARGRVSGRPPLRSRNLALAGPAAAAEDFT